MLFIIILLVLVVIIIVYGKKPVSPISNWHHHFDEFHISAQELFTLVEEGIKKRKLPGVSFSRVREAESHILSARREYLRVSRNEYVFDIGAAAFGTGFYVSWWFAEKEEGVISKIPILKKLTGKDRTSKTYYQKDTETMYRSGVHSVVLSVLDELSSGKGLRPISDLDRQYKDTK